MDNALRATKEQLEAVNKRLQKGEGWIGYRNIGKNPDGSKKYSPFLYYAFYKLNGDGKKHQAFVNAETNDPEEAYNQLLDARGKVERGITVLPTEAARITYEDLKQKYIDVNPERKNAKWKPLDDFFGNVKATQIIADTLQRYITHRRKQGIQDPTIRRELVVLRATYNRAVEDKELSHDQMPYFRMPDDSEAAGTYIPPEKFEKVLESLPDGTERVGKNGGPRSKTNLHPFFTFMYATGCRLTAARKIMWHHISQDCTVITLPPGFAKNRRPLTIALAGPFLEPVVKELRKMFRDESKPVFDSTNYRPEWNKACAKAGIGTWDPETRTRTGVRIHDCRCSGAINLLESGVDEGLVLKIGGWKTRAMLDRYNVTSVERLKAAMEKSGKYITDRMKVAGNGQSR